MEISSDFCLECLSKLRRGKLVCVFGYFLCSQWSFFMVSNWQAVLLFLPLFYHAWATPAAPWLQHIMHCPLGLVTQRAFLCCVYSVTIPVSGFHLGHPTPTHTHAHTYQRTGRLCIYMRYLCGRMWACAIYAHVSISAWDVNWIFYYHIPKYAQKWMFLWPHLLDATAGRCEYVSQHAKLPVKYFPNIFTLAHTHLAAHTHTLCTVELLYKKRKIFIVFLWKSLLRFIAWLCKVL